MFHGLMNNPVYKNFGLYVIFFGIILSILQDAQACILILKVKFDDWQYFLIFIYRTPLGLST